MADLSLLPQAALTERGITAHIASRFHQGMPFCTISSRTLVAVNTFTGSLDVNQVQVYQDLATRVQNRMSSKLENQCVVFLGESGSGKTESAESLLASLLTLAGNPLSTRVRSVQPILEAFSTAKTLNSPHASRAGLIKELQYDSEANLVGFALCDFRLERQRVTRVNTNERNYQVFYYMVNGLSVQERKHLQLENRSFRFLGHFSQMHLSGVDDRQKFKQLKLAMYSLNFSRPDVANIFQILAAILHLGEIKLRDAAHDASIAPTAAVQVVNTDVLELIAQFLGVPTDVLVTSIISKTVTVNNDRFTVVLDQKGARAEADSLARMLYTMLFSHITDRINQELALDTHSPTTAATISLADFPGFQPSTPLLGTSPRDSQTPHLDKLLNNCANEMWYNYMVHVYFRAPQDLLESEDVNVPPSEYFDNAETVKILAKPHAGALAVVNEYARRDRDAWALRDSLARRFPNSNIVNVSDDKFVVNHFAGESAYSIAGLLSSAQESISTDVIGLFVQYSSNEFLKRVFSSSIVVDSTLDSTVVEAHISSEPRRQLSTRDTRDGPVRTGTVQRSGTLRYDPRMRRRLSNPGLAREKQGRVREKKRVSGVISYVYALDEAIDSLESANAYFVLCLKPNDARLVSSLDARCVRQQVSALGIPELALRTKNTDLSMFMPFAEFLRLQHMHGDEDTGLDPDFGNNTVSEKETETDRIKAIKIIDAKGWLARDAVAGVTGVFLSESAWIALVDPHFRFVDEAAAKFQNAKGGLDDFDYSSNLESTNLAGGFGNMFSYMPKRRDVIEHASDIPYDTVDFTAPPRQSRERKTWLAIVWMYTWWYPTMFIRGTFASVKLAWREKLAINMIIWGICAGSMIILIGLPYFICPLQNILSTAELEGYSYQNNPDHVYVAIRGLIYDITKFASTHFPSIVPRTQILAYGGKDASDLFPVPVSDVCSLVTNNKIVIGDPSNYTDTNAAYHDFRAITSDYRPDWYLSHMSYFGLHYFKSFLGFTPEAMRNLVTKKSLAIFSLDGYVFDVTDYVNGNMFNADDSSETVSFFNSTVVDLIQRNLGQDISSKFKKLGLNESTIFETKRCLHNLFLYGKLDTQGSARCLFARYLLLAITCFVVLVIGIKFIAALQFGGYEYPDDLDRFVICQVPVYTEDESSLRRAIDSLTRTKYDDKRKLLVVICDGMIVGAGNEKPTPRIVLDILGHPIDADPPAKSFESLGEGDNQLNYGKIYTGLYETGGHIVPYMVIVKVGKATEVFRPGNRGKRDSQLILMRFFNRVHYNTPMNPLELEMYHQMQDIIGVPPAYYQFLMQVDADTEVSRESLSQLMGKMVRDTHIQAICGETELSNAKESITTMMQVYEYYISHNLSKAFESLFGTVTCLPGCFSLYRLFEEDSGRPLLVSHPVLEHYSENNVRTLHMKNLLQLGEDRYLTTLLLKYNPRFSTKFLRHAHAYTIAPDSWQVLLSQRRRWINSTVHNMVELTPMNQMCGFCCFSMRFMVLVDLFSTFIQPCTLAYIAYLIYLCSTRGGTVPWSSIALLLAVYGLQIIIFVLRLKWEMIGWMFVYLLALPVHSLILPLYSFWYMDDFSWGNTRMVVGEKGKKVLVNDEGEFDPNDIPRRTWQDYQSERWNNKDATPFGDAHKVSRSDSDTLSLAPTVQALNDPFRDTMVQETDSIAESALSAPFASQPSDYELTAAIRDILAKSDLSQVTKRSVRKQLEQRYGISLNNRKEYISWAIEGILSTEL